MDTTKPQAALINISMRRGELVDEQESGTASGAGERGIAGAQSRECTGRANTVRRTGCGGRCPPYSLTTLRIGRTVPQLLQLGHCQWWALAPNPQWLQRYIAL